MSWDQIGFTEGLTRSENLPTVTQDLDPLQFEQFAPEFSGSKLTGIIQSQDGRVKLDLDNNTLIISDGIIEVIRLGKLDDDTYGLVIKDKNGIELMRIGSTNFIKSADNIIEFNFDDKRFIVRDIGGTPQIVLGEV